MKLININKKKKNTITKIILAISIPVLLCFVLEYTLAFVGINSDLVIFEVKLNQKMNTQDYRYWHIYKDKYFIYDPEFLWKGNPGKYGFNSFGFKCPEFDKKKKPYQRYIFCIGDSNTLGYDLSYSYPDFLKIYINENSKPNDRFFVYNLGIWGYSSYQGLMVFEKMVKYNPDIVIISFGWNDVNKVKKYDDKMMVKKLKHHNQKIKKALFKTKTFNFARRIKINQRKKAEYKYRVSLFDFIENHRKIIDICKNRNIKCILLTRPYQITEENKDNKIFKDLQQYNKKLKNSFSHKGVYVIDISNEFFDRDEFVDSCHNNLKGLKKLGKHLANYILKRDAEGWIKEE